MEYGARCRVEGCGWHESWDTDFAARAAANYHVWDDHRDLWVYWVGADEGQDPPKYQRPEAYGRRYEAWESQL